MLRRPCSDGQRNHPLCKMLYNKGTSFVRMYVFRISMQNHQLHQLSLRNIFSICIKHNLCVSFTKLVFIALCPEVKNVLYVYIYISSHTRSSVHEVQQIIKIDQYLVVRQLQDRTQINYLKVPFCFVERTSHLKLFSQHNASPNDVSGRY